MADIGQAIKDHGFHDLRKICGHQDLRDANWYPQLQILRRKWLLLRAVFFFVAFSSDFPYFRFDQTNDEYFNLFVHFQNNFPSLKRRVCWFNASLILDGWIHQSKIFYSSSGSRSFPPGSSAFQVHLAQIYAQITETDWTNSITALRFGFQRRSILYLSLISFLPFWKHVTYLGHPKFTNNE